MEDPHKPVILSTPVRPSMPFAGFKISPDKPPEVRTTPGASLPVSSASWMARGIRRPHLLGVSAKSKSIRPHYCLSFGIPQATIEFEDLRSRLRPASGRLYKENPGRGSHLQPSHVRFGSTIVERMSSRRSSGNSFINSNTPPMPPRVGPLVSIEHRAL